MGVDMSIFWRDVVALWWECEVDAGERLLVAEGNRLVSVNSGC